MQTIARPSAARFSTSNFSLTALAQARESCLANTNRAYNPKQKEWRVNHPPCGASARSDALAVIHRNSVMIKGSKTASLYTKTKPSDFYTAAYLRDSKLMIHQETKARFAAPDDGRATR